MSLDRWAPIESCPFLLPDDKLALTASVRVYRRCHLIDTPLQITHNLPNELTHELRLLRTGTSFARLQQTTADQQQLYSLLGYLNYIGGLRVQRSVHRKLYVICAHAARGMLGIAYPSIVWRGNGSSHDIVTATFRASWSLLAALTVCGWLVAMGGWESPLIVGTITATIAALLVTSIIIHEMTHAWYIYAQGKGANILQHGLQLVVIHPQLKPHQELRCALFGPLIATCYCAVCGGIGMLAGTPIITVASLLIAIFHGVSLLPWCIDGKVIRQMRHS